MQADLVEASGDGHISLHLAKGKLDDASHILPTTNSDAGIYHELLSEQDNEHQIGYLRVDTFSGGMKIKEQIGTAMLALSTSDSLVIDLRQNGGGDPDLVVFLASYFLAKNTPLWSLLDRNGETVFKAKSIDSEYTYHKPLCILTSVETYSAAEAFAYTLKHLDRACIAGEASGGGGHLVHMERVNDEVDIRIPVLRAYNSVTESNWQGGGVIPTINAEVSHAKLAAIQYLIAKTE